MTINVTATCAWCLTIVSTTVKHPVPKDWLTFDVQNPKLDGEPTIQENFCSREHKENYLEVATSCHEAAAIDYTAKFYATMNKQREAAKKEQA